MRVFFLTILILLVTSCATQAPVRNIASVPKPLRIEKPAELDLKKSNVLIFPAIADGDGLWYFFYVQLKDSNGKYIDCMPSEIGLKTHKGKDIPFKFQKVLTGRYYLTLEKTADISSGQLDIFIRGKALKEQFQLHMGHPDKAHTKISVIQNTRNKLTFRLRLADKMNQPVVAPEQPEILLEGQGAIDEMVHIQEGVWEFSIIYPEGNQIMYFSVRAQGVYLANIFRYQHVEK
jgi:hypothetical protein